LRPPAIPNTTSVHNILITGIGGTGVITIGALLGMAAHLDGKAVSVLDMTGMSQKNGAVTSHVRIGPEASTLRAQRIPTGEAHLVLGCDMLTAAAPDAIAKMRAEHTFALVNAFEQPTGKFAQDPDWRFPAHAARARIAEAVGKRCDFIDATLLATCLVGDAIGANLLVLGFAWQRGLIPVSLDAVLRAIELNGVAVDLNRTAFAWGRQAAVDLAAVTRAAVPAQAVSVQRAETLASCLERRVELLTTYQSAAYASAYRAFVLRVEAAEASRHASHAFTHAVARGLAKLMAYKDEYEVARLHCAPALREAIACEFEGDARLRFHLAPPLLAGTLDDQGRPRKRVFGGWIVPAFRVLARLRFLRGTAFDPFGRTPERREERQLVADYRASIERIAASFGTVDIDAALALARIPEQIRGFGPVKRASIEAARAQWRTLEERLWRPHTPAGTAERVATDVVAVHSQPA
ncbi:MAG: 2-oxoacid:acceptor oxidoreductase family protein, partial [Burkholderiales bacterium]|nr:2-oxoacid:acceptor oxidoreductase family protein [Burkholderiales bacterium]